MLVRALTRLRLVSAIFCLAQAGCALPGAGPNAQRIIDQPGASDQTFAVVDVQPDVLNVLADRKPPSLAARFGSAHRAPKVRIVSGDVIAVSLWEAPPGTLFTGSTRSDRVEGTSGATTIPPQSVGNDGTIRVPFAGRINVVGQTAADVEKSVTAALAHKAVQPQVLVEVRQSALNTVTVTGEVTGGARVPVTAGGQRVLDVIAAAGGLKVPVKESVIELTRGSATARASFESVVSSPPENVFVYPGDTVTVVREPRTFTVLGATTHNAEIPFESDNVSIGEALAQAGGLEDSRADPAGVFLFRLEPYAIAQKLLPPDCPLLDQHGMTPIVYRFDLFKPVVFGMLNHFWIEPNDMIYVANASGAETAKFLNISQGAVGNSLAAGAIAVTAIRY
jgi:polysaccharide export outer membrane protein